MKNHILLALCALACGRPGVHVKDRTCGGCIDAAGFCKLGNEPTACGLGGGECVACPADQQCGGDGQCAALDGGDTLPDAGPTAPDGGLDDCAAEARLVYVLDQDRTLLSFDPKLVGTTTEPFVALGRVSCPSEPAAEPFSMAVDRHATAWIVFDDGELFTVDLKAAPLACVKTAFVPQYNVARFGMGFVANSAGSSEETLFIAGSDLNASLTTTRFGVLDTAPPHRLRLLGTLTGAPEISGTGDGKLWAFFPNVSPPKVAQLSKTDGSASSFFTAQALAGTPRAWAFAVWGGDFFLFLQRDVEVSTVLWRMDGQTGEVTRVGALLDRHIVGAGVSTCAPVEIN